MTKTRKNREEINNYKVMEKFDYFNFQKIYQGKKYLKKEWRQIPDVLLKEYYEKNKKLNDINKKIEEITTDWVKTHKELLELDQIINKLKV